MADKRKSCKAAVLVAYGQPDEIWDVKLPEVEKDGILVKVRLAGICGTDVHQNAGDLNIVRPLPIIQGHETIAEIVELGLERTCDLVGTPLKVGDRIIWAHKWCGECYYCKVVRKPYMCTNSFLYGYGQPDVLAGGFSEYEYVTPGTEVLRIPDVLKDEEVLGIGCACRSVVAGFQRLQEHSPIAIGDTVVVQGTGPIGLYAILMAANSGAAKVIAVGAPEGRLALAKKWGATHVINVETMTNPVDRVKMVLDITNGLGADCCIEGSGFPPAFDEGFDYIRKAGTYLVLGQCSDTKIEFAPGKVVAKHAVIIGNVGADITHFHRALKFIEANREKYDFSELLSTMYDLEDINVALDSMRKGTDIKATIDMRKRS